MLTTHPGRPALLYLSSVLVNRKLLPLQSSGPRAFGLYVLGGVSARLGKVNTRRRKKEKGFEGGGL